MLPVGRPSSDFLALMIHQNSFYLEDIKKAASLEAAFFNDLVFKLFKIF